MSTGYRVASFQGQIRSGESAQAVAAQLEALLNGAAAAASDISVLRVVAPVSIQVQPGCLGRLFGAETSWLQFDQVIMGPDTAAKGIVTQAAQTSRLGPSAVPALRDGASHGQSTDRVGALSTVTSIWTGLPRLLRRGILVVGVLLLLKWWWSGSNDAAPPAPMPANRPVESRPTAARPVQPPVATRPAPAPPGGRLTTPAKPETQTSGSRQGSVQQPVLAPGDRWLTDVTDHQDARLNYQSERVVVEVAQGRVVTTARTLKNNYTRTIDFDPGWGLLSSRHPNGSSTTYAPALQYMRFPMQPGATWSQQVVETASSGERKLHKISATVKGWERVTVPAGSFDALRVELNDHIELNGTVVQQGLDVSWYVPAVKRSVKSEETSVNPSTGERRQRTIQLLEFSVR